MTEQKPTEACQDQESPETPNHEAECCLPQREVPQGGHATSAKQGLLTQKLSFRVEVACLAFVLLWAFAVRVYHLNDVPVNLMCDEADNLSDCLRVLHGRGPGIFGFDWKPQPAFSIYLMSGFLRVLGVHIWSVRFPSAILSLLALIPFYYLAKRVTSQIAALAAAFLMANGIWYLHFSRSAWENIHICFYLLMAFWLLEKAVSGGKWWYAYFAGSGFFAGIGILGYFAGKFILPSLLLAFPLYIVIHRKQWKRVVSGFAIVVVVALGVSAPHLKIARLPQNREYAARRIANVYLFNNPEGKGPLLEVMTRQVTRNIKGFFDPTMNNQPRYGRVRHTPLDYVTGAFFAFGAIISLFHLRHTWIWWAMLLTQFVFGQLLTRGTPDPARGVPMIPTIYFFVALSVDLFPRYWYGFWQRRFPIALCLLCLILAWYNVSGYFEWCYSDDAIRNRDPMVETDEFPYWLQAQLELLQQQKGTFNLDQWKQRLRAQVMEKVRPSPKTYSGDGGLMMFLYDNASWEGTPRRVVQKAPVELPADPPEGSYSITWKGRMLIERKGRYTFGLNSDDGSELLINGKRIVDNRGQHGAQERIGRVVLQAGEHDVVIHYFQADGASRLEFWWKPPLTDKESVPLGILIPEQ